MASSTLSHVNSSDENNFRKFLSSPKIPKILNSIFLSHCDEPELIDIMKEFDNNKASDININVLKSISKLIVGHLVKIFNKFLDIGIFPTILKSGMITPIFKKGDSRYFDIYRPVSTLPVFGKILEKLMYNRLYSFLSSKNIIFRNQFGFRKKHSTSHAVNYSVDKVITEIEKKKHVIGIFIDLSKAFDTIEHGILLDKLEHYGIRGKLHTLIKSYISLIKSYIYLGCHLTNVLLSIDGVICRKWEKNSNEKPIYLACLPQYIRLHFHQQSCFLIQSLRDQ